MAPLILCPLRFECARLRPWAAAVGWRIACCGPGPEGVGRWRRDDAADLGPGAKVVLAGVAGSLDEQHSVGSAWIITEVADFDGSVVTAPWVDAGTPRCVVASNPEPIVNPQERRRWAVQTGAHLMDCESQAFATCATAAGWHWGIVRGVSDGPLTQLPENVGRWVSASGRVRPTVVIEACLRRPSIFRSLREMRRNGVAAIEAVAGKLRSLAAG